MMMSLNMLMMERNLADYDYDNRVKCDYDYDNYEMMIMRALCLIIILLSRKNHHDYLLII